MTYHAQEEDEMREILARVHDSFGLAKTAVVIRTPGSEPSSIGFGACIAAMRRVRQTGRGDEWLVADIENREARRVEILDWLQKKIGTAWRCDNCAYSTYHAFANECADCGAEFPLLNMLAFKLHASHTDATIPVPAHEEGEK